MVDELIICLKDKVFCFPFPFTSGVPRIIHDKNAYTTDLIDLMTFFFKVLKFLGEKNPEYMAQHLPYDNNSKECF